MLQQVGNLQVETLVKAGGLQVFVYDRQGQPLNLRNARAQALLQIPNGVKRYRYDLIPQMESSKQAHSLATAVDLSQIAGKEVQLTFHFFRLPELGLENESFQVSARVPMSEQQAVRAAIASQKICPVSNQSLGSMGRPIPVDLGEQTVYVCCAGCIEPLKENPDKYLAVKPTLQISSATAADSEAIARQKVCPVMDEPLGSMGTPLKVTGLGRDVFLCCKGCVKFLEKEPGKYLSKLPQEVQSKKHTVEKATQSDERFVTAQNTCPVMDEPLDAMGGPYRTELAGRIVYLCCPGCAKKLHSDPEKYLEKLASRGVKPPVARR